MTHRRRQVFERYREAILSGERVSLARMARECGMYDYRDARRVVNDLRRMAVLG